MWKKSAIVVSGKNVARINDGLLRKPEVITLDGNCSTRDASSGKSDVPVKQETPDPLRSGLQASFPRGPGGRQSFSGNVCTVFGSSGFFGKYVINQLGREGTQVIIPYRADPYFVRHLKTAGDLGQILFFPFDLKDEESIRKVVRYSNVVINMIGRDYETMNYSFDGVNAEGAARIARISREMGVKRLIHFSALNATKEPVECYIPGGSRFLKSKALGEEMVRNEFPDAIIIRPSDVFGWDDRIFFPYCSYFRKNIVHQLCLHRCGNHTYKGPVHVRNVAQGVMRLLHDPTTDGRVYEFVGPYWYQLGDLLDYINRLTHHYETPFYMRRHIDGWTALKTNFFELKSMLNKRQAPWDWEKIERQETISDELTGCPTLTDLGVTLDTVEDKLPSLIDVFDRVAFYKPEIGEFPEAPWPTRLPPMHKKTTTTLLETYGDTVFRPAASVELNA